MERRNFVKKSLIGAGALGMTGTAKAFSKPPSSSNKDDTFNLNYAPHQGMFRNHAGDDFVDQIKFMADRGFRGIEDNRSEERTSELQSRGHLVCRLLLEKKNKA